MKLDFHLDENKLPPDGHRLRPNGEESPTPVEPPKWLFKVC